MEQIPNEILVHVLQYIDPDEIKNMFCLSKKINNSLKQWFSTMTAFPNRRLYQFWYWYNLKQVKLGKRELKECKFPIPEIDKIHGNFKSICTSLFSNKIILNALLQDPSKQTSTIKKAYSYINPWERSIVKEICDDPITKTSTFWSYNLFNQTTEQTEFKDPVDLYTFSSIDDKDTKIIDKRPNPNHLYNCTKSIYAPDERIDCSFNRNDDIMTIKEKRTDKLVCEIQMESFPDQKRFKCKCYAVSLHFDFIVFTPRKKNDKHMNEYYSFNRLTKAITRIYIDGEGIPNNRFPTFIRLSNCYKCLGKLDIKDSGTFLSICFKNQLYGGKLEWILEQNSNVLKFVVKDEFPKYPSSDVKISIIKDTRQTLVVTSRRLPWVFDLVKFTDFKTKFESVIPLPVNTFLYCDRHDIETFSNGKSTLFPISKLFKLGYKDMLLPYKNGFLKITPNMNEITIYTF